MNGSRARAPDVAVRRSNLGNVSHQNGIAGSINHVGESDWGRDAMVVKHAAVVWAAAIALAGQRTGCRGGNGAVARAAAAAVASPGPIASVGICGGAGNIIEAVAIAADVVGDGSQERPRISSIRSGRSGSASRYRKRAIIPEGEFGVGRAGERRQTNLPNLGHRRAGNRIVEVDFGVQRLPAQSTAKAAPGSPSHRGLQNRRPWETPCENRDSCAGPAPTASSCCCTGSAGLIRGRLARPEAKGRSVSR